MESANKLPKWINPDVDANRVWIHKGKLLLIPAEGNNGKPGKLSLHEAVNFIKSSPELLFYDSSVESEAFYRLEKYPGYISTTLHYATVTIPRKLAFILRTVPKSIAPAVECFYVQDPTGMKSLIKAVPQTTAASLTFPPRDLVTISVKFTRVLYAQLKSQPFSLVPPVWAVVLRPAERAATSKSASAEEMKLFARLELGMKLCVGFELLAQNMEHTDSKAVREVAIMLEDLAEDGDSTLPTDAEIQAWPHSKRDDDDSWMDIDFDDLDKELGGKIPKARTEQEKDKAGFADATTQADLRKMVERFEAFLNDDTAGIQGADDVGTDESDWEDDTSDEHEDVTFDEKDFARMMRDMMGMPTNTTDYSVAPSHLHAVSNVEEIVSSDEERSHDDEAIQKLTKEMEAELKQHGALKLGSEQASNKTVQVCDKLGKTALPSFKGKEYAQLQFAEESDEDNEIDIDYNLAKNLLESFKSQAGLAGPAGNILGMMGMKLPRDEGEVYEDNPSN